MKQRGGVNLPCAALAALLLLLPETASAQRGPILVDTAFAYDVPEPAHALGAGPLVLIDDAHHNVHSLEGFYGPFGALLRADGYRVAPLRERISAAALDGASVLVISNALPAATQGNGETIVSGRGGRVSHGAM